MCKIFDLIVDAGADIDILALVSGIADIVNSKIETERAINKLLEMKLFDEARKFAELLNFPKDITFIAEVSYCFKFSWIFSFKNKLLKCLRHFRMYYQLQIVFGIFGLSQTKLWSSIETRLTFWENSRQFLKDRGCTSSAVYKFFKVLLLINVVEQNFYNGIVLIVIVNIFLGFRERAV